jgi:hypothetical protein
LTALSATNAAAEIASGALSAEDYTRACLERIAEVDGEVKAFVHLDPDYAIEQARRRDEVRASGRPVGPLHGIPVAIKDIIDTGDYPTECGSPLFSGRQPRQDATVVDRPARGRRRHHRQDGDHRIRLFPSRQDPQPARHRAHARRLVVGIGGGGRGRHGAARHRHADQRFDHPSRRSAAYSRSNRRTASFRGTAFCRSRAPSIMSVRSPARSRTSQPLWK